MKILPKVKVGLEKKFQKVLKTPDSFAFFEAIHDFIEHIEVNTLTATLSSNTKANIALNIPNKYNHLKQIYQALEDANTKSDADLGHTRYAVLNEIKKIQNNDVSESNTFWKKRDLFRKLVGEIYQKLIPTEV
ncbi:MAG: hypothetical protein G01um10143_587 [Parcubacteria group bacterium Gr01-1014_3]|nr:MAG: hypothetical protein G01um10143_587 [Parcubacteria group bacterium Gr01-1014_3]